jgi:hypothetical protein
VLYTDRLNVGSRRVIDFFPGVPDATHSFAVDYKGNFNVLSEANYAFHLISDDGAIVWIDGQSVIDNDGIHAPENRSAVVHLTAGKHSMRVLFFENGLGLMALQLFVSLPGQKEQLWSPEF